MQPYYASQVMGKILDRVPGYDRYQIRERIGGDPAVDPHALYVGGELVATGQRGALKNLIGMALAEAARGRH